MTLAFSGGKKHGATPDVCDCADPMALVWLSQRNMTKNELEKK